MIRPLSKGEISFEKIAQIRTELCRDASLYSSILNVTKQWPTACVWIEARLSENNGHQSFGFRETARPALRAVHRTPNEAARHLSMGIIPNFRVPSQSVVHRVFFEDRPYAEADESLVMRESSGGTRLSDWRVRIKAKGIGDSVPVLILPL